MDYTDLLGWCEAYEIAIEPIHASTLLRKYTHVLVVKRNGVRIDVGQVVYLSPQRKIGIADARGRLSWYRSGAIHQSVSGVIEARIESFSVWLYGLIEQLRRHLLEVEQPSSRCLAS